MSTSFVAAYVLPSIAESNPGYVNDVLAAASGGHAPPATSACCRP